MRTEALPIAVLLLVLLPSSPAAAVTPVVIDGRTATVRDPSIAVDAQGNGLIVWTATGPGVSDDVTEYCLIARASKTCSVRQSFAPGGDDTTGPRVVLPPNPDSDPRVFILTTRCCDQARDHLLLFRSDDNGKTFAPPREIGNGDPEGAAIFGPGEFSLSVISDQTTSGVQYQAAPIDAAAPATAQAVVGDNPGGPDAEVDGGLALADNVTPIARMSDATTSSSGVGRGP